jgi:hypothetical protein
MRLERLTGGFMGVLFNYLLGPREFNYLLGPTNRYELVEKNNPYLLLGRGY